MTTGESNYLIGSIGFEPNKYNYTNMSLLNYCEAPIIEDFLNSFSHCTSHFSHSSVNIICEHYNTLVKVITGASIFSHAIINTRKISPRKIFCQLILKSFKVPWECLEHQSCSSQWQTCEQQAQVLSIESRACSSFVSSICCSG